MHTTIRPVWIGSLLLALSCHAAASPWLLSAGEVVVSTRFDYAQADQEFLASNGRLTHFSLDGKYSSSTYTLGARFGLSDWLELEMSLPMRRVVYTADPVILVPTDRTGNAGFDYYQENVIDLNQEVSGFADLHVAGRFQVIKRPIAIALELSISAPTGYDPPEGTFGESPSSTADFLADPGRYARPENVRDDVTLGDGKLAITPAFLLGYGSGFGFFARTSAGVRFRFNGAGDAFVSELKFGQMVRKWLLIYAGAGLEWTITKGDVIGVSVAAKNAKLPASQYGGLTNLELIEVTLDRDQLLIPIGAIIQVLDGVEFNFAYGQVVWGRNVARSHNLSAGVSVKTAFLER
ncbi:MAG: hypothetical protein VX589_14365 [Myxococcota bacterium]|nr:hypothetical protein [Myxococcota bacterium]